MLQLRGNIAQLLAEEPDHRDYRSQWSHFSPAIPANRGTRQARGNDKLHRFRQRSARHGRRAWPQRPLQSR